MKHTTKVLPQLVLLVVSLVLLAHAAEIGFNFTGRLPGSPEGDLTAPTHLFVHLYPVPQPGIVTGVTYRNDSDVGDPQPISVLILRPVAGGWNVIDREDLPDSAFHHGVAGDTTYPFPAPVSVNPGDIFAHWQEQFAGPIPVNLTEVHVEGGSKAQFGFGSADIDPGSFISSGGYDRNTTDLRDYFINLDFVAVPEPSTFTLGILGALSFAAGVRRLRRNPS